MIKCENKFKVDLLSQKYSTLCLALQVTIQVPVRRYILCLSAFIRLCLDNRAITFGHLLVYLWVHQVLPCLDQIICQKYQAPCLGFSQNGQWYLNGRLFAFGQLSQSWVVTIKFLLKVHVYMHNKLKEEGYSHVTHKRNIFTWKQCNNCAILETLAVYIKKSCLCISLYLSSKWIMWIIGLMSPVFPRLLT